MDDLAIKRREKAVYDEPFLERPGLTELANEEHYAELQQYAHVGAFKEALRRYASGPTLDLGCGTGWLADVILQTADVEVYYGVDLSETRLRAATASVDGGAAFSFADAERLPFADSTFETVACSAVLHHLPNWDTAGLDEIQRVLRPEGTLVFLEPLKFNPLVVLYRRIFPTQTQTPDEHPFNPWRLKRVLRSRFDLVEWTGHSLVAPTIPFLDRWLPVSVPVTVSKRVYDLERAIIDRTTVGFCHTVTGVAIKRESAQPPATAGEPTGERGRSAAEERGQVGVAGASEPG